jgi:MFS family permease
VTKLIATTTIRIMGFVRRQKHNYWVAITRSAASGFLMNLTAQYDSIYIVSLGVNALGLGVINGIGNAISALVSTPVGWLMDRYGIKRLYLLAIALAAGGALIYALSFTWQIIIIGIILFSVSIRLTGTGCSVICADSVMNKDRATSQNLCVTLASLVSMVAPLIAASLVTLSGGLNTQGIRPLYYLAFIGYILVFILVAAKLREPKRERVVEERITNSFIDDFKWLFKERGPLRRWIVVTSLTSLPAAMTLPFFQLFAYEVKGADQYLLGGMTSAAVITRLLFGIPLGRLADRIGRKKVIYLLTPLWYASSLLLVFSFSSASLILSGALQTFYLISSGITAAMTLELVSLERIGRWSGVLGLFQGLIIIPAPILGGIIWRELGPIYVFLIPLGVDLMLRIPMLITIPETLKSRLQSGKGELIQ